MKIELLHTMIKRNPYYFELIATYLHPPKPNRIPGENNTSRMVETMGTLAECLAAQAELHRKHWGYTPAPSTANCQVLDRR